MKNRTILFGILILALGVASAASAKPHIYKWVKDKSISSDLVLKEPQASRVVSLNEASALEAVRRVMTDDLYMALTEYHGTRHRQDGETVKDTVMPESVVGRQEVDLVDEDYRFILEVRLKAYGSRTRILAKASPMYRLRDWEKEEEQDDAEEQDASVDLKIKAPRGSAVGMEASVFILPMEGVPSEYQLEPLPDAADRAGKLVRSFLYLLDQRLAGKIPEK